MTATEETPTPEPGTKPSTGSVTERLAAVMADMTAVGKDRKADAKMGGYSFRGIEDVANAVHPLLSRHGLVLRTETLEHSVAPRQVQTNSGGTKERRETLLHVRYSVAAPDGSTAVLGDWWGEGDAYDDKGTNKAYSAALKLCLLQSFVIPTQDLMDTEAAVDQHAGAITSAPDDPAPQGGPTFASLAQLEAVKEAGLALPVEQRTEWAKSELATSYRAAFKEGTVSVAMAEAALAAIARLTPTAPPGELIEDEEPF